MADLRVVATIPVKPEAAEAIRGALGDLVTATRAEEGCIAYEAFESQSSPGTFITIETWRSQDDLDAHMKTEHIAAAFGALDGNAAGEVAIHPLTPLD